MFREEVQVLFTAAMRCDGVCKVYGTAIKDGKVCMCRKHQPAPIDPRRWRIRSK